MLIENLIVKEL